MKFDRIIFFGASVTAQKSIVEGRTTGYYPNIEEMLRTKYGTNLDIHRISMVGSHFDSAANMCMSDFEHLLGDKTLLVSEWHSTTLPRFEDRALRAYFDRLDQSGAAVLNLVIPMLSCIGQERTNIRQTRSAQASRVWQLNLYKSELDFRACIRDEQHTTVIGGKAYAEIIFEAIKTLLKGGTIPRDEGDELSFRTSDAPYPPIAIRKFEGDFRPGTEFVITLPPSSKKRRIQIYSKLRKGPETAQLQIDAAGAHYIFDTWNRYTYYPHAWSTFGPISPMLELEPKDDTISVKVTPNIPDYATLAKGLDKPLLYMSNMEPHTKMLRIVGGIYLLGVDEFQLEVRE